MSEWVEYRAIYTRAASYLDKNAVDNRVTEVTRGFPSRAEAYSNAMQRSEENFAFVTDYEKRTVTATDWEADV